jgi:tetratricopeptide (TPR) repeat protein
MYLRIVDAAARHQIGQAKLWDNPDLAFALQWRENNRPNRVWAQRYHPAFDSAMAFLDQSLKHRRYKGAAILLLLAVVIGIPAILTYRAQQRQVAVQQERLAAERRALEAQQAQTANLIMVEGLEKASEGQFNEAITAYKRAVAIKSDYAPAYYNLGVAYLRQDDAENALKTFEQFQQLTTDAERRQRAESFIRAIQSPPTNAPPAPDPAAVDKRAQLVKEMFSEDKATRITATTALIAGWKKDPHLVPVVVNMAQENTANRSGVINALVVLESVEPALLLPYKSELNRLLIAVADNGPQTLEHVQKLRQVKGLSMPR